MQKPDFELLPKPRKISVGYFLKLLLILFLFTIAAFLIIEYTRTYVVIP